MPEQMPELVIPFRCMPMADDTFDEVSESDVLPWIEALDNYGLSNVINRFTTREEVIGLAASAMRNLVGEEAAFMHDRFVVPEQIEPEGFSAYWLEIGIFWQTDLWPVIVGLISKGYKAGLYSSFFSEEIEHTESVCQDEVAYYTTQVESLKKRIEAVRLIEGKPSLPELETKLLEAENDLDAKASYVHEDWMKPWFRKVEKDLSVKGAAKYEKQLSKSIEMSFLINKRMKARLGLVAAMIDKHVEKYGDFWREDEIDTELRNMGFEGYHDFNINCIAWGENDDTLYSNIEYRCESYKQELGCYSYFRNIRVANGKIVENHADAQAAIDRVALRKLLWECVDQLRDLLNKKRFKGQLKRP